MNSALLVLRLVVGLSFVAHGAQKLFGWFGGSGPAGTRVQMESKGYRAPGLMALLAGLGELGGGGLLTTGAATPLATLAICTVMVNAIVTSHLTHGYWNYRGGYELNLAYIAIALALALAGPGAWSVDRVAGWDDELSGPGIAAIVAGVACLASFSTLVLGRHPEVSRPRA